MTYIYRRLDNDELIEVDWATMMTQRDGFITLPDGTEARRCVYLEQQAERAAKRQKVQPEIVSVALGVTGHQVEEFRRLAEANGHRVEFKPDPHEPNVYDAYFPSWKERDKYAKWRGMSRDRNSRNGSGAGYGPVLLQRATELVKRQHSAS